MLVRRLMKKTPRIVGEIDGEVAAHFSGRRFARIDRHSFFCKDSRGDCDNFGAAGGDFGEFLLALDCYTRIVVGGVEGSESQNALNNSVASLESSHPSPPLKDPSSNNPGWVKEKFLEWLKWSKCDAKRPFYLHSDREAMKHLFESIGRPSDSSPLLENLKSDEDREAFMKEFIGDGAAQGCGHLRLILADSAREKYKIAPELFEALARAFFELFWAGDERVQFKIYENQQEGRALAIIKPADQSGDEESAKKDPTKAKKSLMGRQQLEQSDQVFILNQHAVSAYRKQYLVPFFTREKADEMFREMEEKGWRNAMMTANALAPGKPIYEIKLE